MFYYFCTIPAHPSDVAFRRRPANGDYPTQQRRVPQNGAFLAFVPEQDANGIRVAEDGFLVLLTNNAWQTIRESLIVRHGCIVTLAEWEE